MIDKKVVYNRKKITDEHGKLFGELVSDMAISWIEKYYNKSRGGVDLRPLLAIKDIREKKKIFGEDDKFGAAVKEIVLSYNDLHKICELKGGVDMPNILIN